MPHTGTWPRQEKLAPDPPEHPDGQWVVLATDRHQCGQPIKAVSRDFSHLTDEIPGKEFARFRTREEGERWLYDNRAHLKLVNYRYTVATL